MNNTSTIIHAAIDVSGPEASFALTIDNNPCPVFTEYRPMRGRTAAALPEWLIATLTKHGFELHQINRWTIGSGPGSFTGLRMTASLVAGLTFNRKHIMSRCLPTALAMVADFHSPVGTATACLFDGRNQELLLYGVTSLADTVAPSGTSSVISAENAAEALQGYSRIVSFARDRDAIALLLPSELAEQVCYIEQLPIAAMLRITSDNWNNDLTDLVYIRQAVFTQPICEPAKEIS